MEARRAARDIREIDKAAEGGSGPLEKLSGFMQSLAENAANAGGRTRIFGFAVGTVAAAGVAAIPIVVGLGGALVAVVGSLAAATIGAGLLAGALTVTLGAAFGAVGLVLFDAMKNFSEVNTRFQTWRNAVASFGRDSDQAQTAFARLTGVIANNGGPVIYNAVKAFQELRDEFETQMSPVIMKLYGAFEFLFEQLLGWLPTLVKFTDTVVTALGPTFRLFINTLTGSEVGAGLSAIAGGFAQIIGPIGQGVVNIFLGLLRLVVRMQPYLGAVATGFGDITGAFLNWASTADLSTFVSSLRDWWGLLKAIGGLLVTVLSSGKAEGDSLVVSLTGVINSWNDALSAPGGKAGMIGFFKDAIDMTEALAGVAAGVVAFIFNFGKAALPLYTTVFNGLRDGWRAFMDALAPAKPFWDNVLGPFLLGLAKGVGGTLIGAFKFAFGVIRIFAIVLGYLGEKAKPLKPAFEILGQIVGFVFGGPILKALGSLGRLSVLLKPLGFIFKMLYQPIRLVGGVFGWIAGKALGIIEVLGRMASMSIPLVRSAWGRFLGFIAGLGPKFFDAGVSLWGKLAKGFMQAIGSGLGFAGDIGKAVFNFIAGAFNTALPNSLGPIPLPDNPIPLLARGGVVSGAGSWITGEAGPELNTMLGGRVIVQPLTPSVVTQGTNVSLTPPEGKRVIIAKVHLRGKQIAEAVADEAEDDAVRRGRRG